MSALARFGLVLLAVSLLADVASHASGGDGYLAHVAIFISMLVVTSGLVHQGLRSNTHSRRGSHVDAHW